MRRSRNPGKVAEPGASEKRCRQQNLGGGGRRSSRSFNVAGEVTAVSGATTDVATHVPTGVFVYFFPRPQ